ncbi:cysteine proteinase inhibitor 1-like [Salvia hispanica]|uniref:cysteine proteinase inhibitor 1-like n=1 Tax=Salvia hispanica TaxID=49212 RepID=UPI002009DA45|nr:cysteine proteinase inhibitor 1-like [Salvia hispanica]
MASSLTLTASFFGGAVAAKPASSTTRRGPLAVRASMDLEKSVAESSNTRRGLVMAAVGAAAVSSVVNVAKAADDTNNTTIGGWRPVVADTSEIFLIAVFAVSEYNKQNNASLVFESVLRAEVQVVNGVNCRLVIVAKDSKTGRSNNYLAVVYGKSVPTTIELTSFVALLR